MADGGGRKECFVIIKDYYQKTINRDLALSSYYEIYERAKSKWLSNVSLPALENYKKNQLIKSEMLQDEIKSKSSKDITDISKALLDNWKYTDSLVGLGSETTTDSIVISINMDKQKTINALEIPDESIDVEVVNKQTTTEG